MTILEQILAGLQQKFTGVDTAGKSSVSCPLNPRDSAPLF